MYKFNKAMIAVFIEVYLREPNVADNSWLLSINEATWFLGMIRSIDFMHWEWKNYHFAWQGQYSGHAERLSSLRLNQ
jgi:hypothetical protein